MIAFYAADILFDTSTISSAFIKHKLFIDFDFLLSILFGESPISKTKMDRFRIAIYAKLIVICTSFEKLFF